MTKIEELKEDIKKLEEEKERLENNENTDEYDEMLDDTGQGAEIGGLTFEPSRILKELDPTAYNVGISDWNDNRISETEEEIDEKQEELKNCRV